MILAKHQIEQAIRNGHLIVRPPPDPSQFSPTALDLHLGADIRRFRPALYDTGGLNVTIDLDQIEIPNLAPHMEALPRETDGSVRLMPNELLIATTVEHIELPPTGRLAARIEGRSRFARLGLVVHMTCPTIHNTFRGRITLEIMNHGPIPLRVRPGQTRLCQLILERVEEEPLEELISPFQDQSTPLGSAG